MENPPSMSISVIWRGKKYNVEINSESTLRQFGQELKILTEVKADTMRLIIPQSSNRSPKMWSPFSDEHGSLSLQEISFSEGKPIRMMGVSKDEVDEVLQNAKKDFRIAGFDEEENRMRQRTLNKPWTLLSLPQGHYIFCEFRTLQIPGIELNPPASEALKRMHMLAADPGIVAVMNKHKWRVGVMTEMAPVGYVGVSPKCILGLNKNRGEEISLRLRTDDLKGFRKYESIKKTLLHELAHMVYSEHDGNFYALLKQLNEEAAHLDWTKSRSHTLTTIRHSQDHEEDPNLIERSTSQKLGGNKSDQLGSARATSVAAAYNRLTHASALCSSKVQEEPDPDDAELSVGGKSHHMMSPTGKENVTSKSLDEALLNPYHKADPDDQNKFEPDPDDQNKFEPDPDDHRKDQSKFEPDPDDCSDHLSKFEPDPDDLENPLNYGVVTEPDCCSSQEINEDQTDLRMVSNSDPRVMLVEPDPDDNLEQQMGFSEMQIDVPDRHDHEIRRIQDSVTLVCSRLNMAIEMLQTEVNPTEASTVLQTLFKIIRNVIEHPEEMKYRRLRKANPLIQRNIAKYKAAMEILLLIGFIEDVVLDEIGKAETFLILKRNDPGLLWLAKSSLESCIAY